MRNHKLYQKKDDESCEHVMQYLYELTATTHFEKIEIENLNSYNGFNDVDLSMTGTTKGNREVYYLIEVKGRNKYSTQYDNYRNMNFKTNNGAMCEIDKYNKILHAANKKKYNPIYACSYTDGVVMLWNLNKLTNDDIVMKNELRGETTVENNGKTNKPCYEINKEKAAILLKNNPNKVYTWDELRLMKK